MQLPWVLPQVARRKADRSRARAVAQLLRALRRTDGADRGRRQAAVRRGRAAPRVPAHGPGGALANPTLPYMQGFKNPRSS